MECRFLCGNKKKDSIMVPLWFIMMILPKAARRKNAKNVCGVIKLFIMHACMHSRRLSVE